MMKLVNLSETWLRVAHKMAPLVQGDRAVSRGPPADPALVAASGPSR